MEGIEMEWTTSTWLFIYSRICRGRCMLLLS